MIIFLEHRAAEQNILMLCSEEGFHQQRNRQSLVDKLAWDCLDIHILHSVLKSFSALPSFSETRDRICGVSLLALWNLHTMVESIHQLLKSGEGLKV